MVIPVTNRRNTRERIIDAAITLFSEVGFAGASIMEIERRVGLSPGSGGFYRHFKSKEAVLQAAVEREVGRFHAEVERVRANLPEGDKPVELLATVYSQRLHQLEGVHHLFRLMFNEGDRVPELRKAMSAALSPSADETDLADSVAIAALGGYHLFSIMQGRPYNGVGETEFVRTLAEMIQLRQNERSVHLEAQHAKTGRLGVLKVHHVNIDVPQDDFEAERAFLVDVVGLRHLPPGIEAPQATHCFEADGGVEVHVGPVSQHRGSHRAHLAFDIGPDMARLKRRLKRDGIAFQQVSNPSGRRLLFKDPVGNLWDIGA